MNTYIAALSSDQGEGSNISDIGKQNSNVFLDYSSDNMMQSTKALENNFQDKYRVLRMAYEDRVRQLTGIVNHTCASLVTDEIVSEMKNDRATLPYIPAHVAEVIERHLESEREKFIHQLANSLSTKEFELAKAVDSNLQLQHRVSDMEKEIANGKQFQVSNSEMAEKIKKLESHITSLNETLEVERQSFKNFNAEFVQRERLLQEKLEITIERFSQKAGEVDNLKRILQEKANELANMEKSLNQSSNDLAIVESIEKHEKHAIRELKEDVAFVTTQRDELSFEVQELRMKLNYANEEVMKTRVLISEKTEEGKINKEKVAELMVQVEQMLAQEANESNTAIAAIHEKMKIFRQRMISEIQREKRYSAALQEELSRMKSIREDASRDIKSMSEQEASMREKFLHEQQMASNLQSEVQVLMNQVTELKSKLLREEARAQIAEERHAETEKLRQQETEILQERARLAAHREKDEEMLHIEQRTAAYKLQYQNDLGQLQNQLRHSYTFGSTMPNPHDSHMSMNVTSLVPAGIPFPDVGNVDLSSELSFRRAMEHWAAEKSQMNIQHTNALAEQEEHFRRNHEKHLELLEARLRHEHEEAISLLRMQLQGSAEQRTFEQQRASHEQLTMQQQTAESQIHSLQSKLREAGENINRLMNMVHESKQTISSQRNIIKHFNQSSKNSSTLPLEFGGYDYGSHASVEEMSAATVEEIASSRFNQQYHHNDMQSNNAALDDMSASMMSSGTTNGLRRSQLNSGGMQTPQPHNSNQQQNTTVAFGRRALVTPSIIRSTTVHSSSSSSSRNANASNSNNNKANANEKNSSAMVTSALEEARLAKIKSAQVESDLENMRRFLVEVQSNSAEELEKSQRAQFELRRKNEDLLRQIATLNARIDTLTSSKKMTAAVIGNDSPTQQLHSYTESDEINRLRQTMTRQQQINISAHTKELEDAHQQAQISLRHRNDELSREVLDLKSKLSHITSTNSSLKQQLDEQREETDRATRHASSLSTSSSASISRLKSQNEEQHREIERLRAAQLQTMTSTTDTIQLRETLEKQHRQALETRTRDLEAAHHQAQMEQKHHIDELNLQLQNMQSKLNMMSAANSALQRQTEEQQAEVERISRHASSLAASTANTSAETAAVLKQQIDSQRMEIERLLSQQSRNNTGDNNAATSVHHMSENLEHEHHKALLSRSRELEEAHFQAQLQSQQRIDELTRQVHNLQLQQENISSTCNMQRRQLDEQQAEIERVNSQLRINASGGGSSAASQRSAKQHGQGDSDTETPTHGRQRRTQHGSTAASSAMSYLNIDASSIGGEDTLLDPHSPRQTRLASEVKRLNDALQHQEELTELASHELSHERERTVAAKKKQIKLYEILTTVDQVYRTKLHEVRQDLSIIRQAVEMYIPFTTGEIKKTIFGLKLQLNTIFQKLGDQKEKQLQATRLSLIKHHNHELADLEARFVSEIKSQSKQHSSELESMHINIVGKAERAIALAGGELPEDLLRPLQHSKSDHRGNKKKDGGDDQVNTSSWGSFSDAAGLTPNSSISRLRRSQDNSEGKLSAFPSVMKGLVDALVQFEIMEEGATAQVEALAMSHNEPSFAAQAGAKILLCGYLDRYISESSMLSAPKRSSSPSLDNPHTRKILDNPQHDNEDDMGNNTWKSSSNIDSHQVMEFISATTTTTIVETNTTNEKTNEE